MNRYPIIRKQALSLLCLCTAILVASCGTIRPAVSPEQKTAAIEIKSTGITPAGKNDKSFVLYFVQYSIDGQLLEAHEIRKNYNRRVRLLPGTHNLFVEHAHRGMLSARALLQKEGECYTFAVADGQTALFEGKALSENKWQADGFADVESSVKKCGLADCRTP